MESGASPAGAACNLGVVTPQQKQQPERAWLRGSLVTRVKPVQRPAAKLARSKRRRLRIQFLARERTGCICKCGRPGTCGSAVAGGAIGAAIASTRRTEIGAPARGNLCKCDLSVTIPPVPLSLGSAISHRGPLRCGAQCRSPARGADYEGECNLSEDGERLRRGVAYAASLGWRELTSATTRRSARRVRQRARAPPPPRTRPAAVASRARAAGRRSGGGACRGSKPRLQYATAERVVPRGASRPS